MERTVQVEVDVREGVTDEEIYDAVTEALEQLEEYDGFGGANVAVIEGAEEQPEVYALYELLDQIDADENTVAEKLEKAQEMALEMLGDSDFMEEYDNE